MTTTPSKTILSISIAQLRGLCLSIESSATAGRIRFIRCGTLVDYNVLEVEEFEEFPTGLMYATISYIWKGNNPTIANRHPDSEKYGYFTVEGAEDGDPISIDVLRCACIAALEYSDEMIDYIWLDRTCIMQSNKNDKSWQITQMFRLYENAEVCFILPGGIHHLVSLDEETSWIHRAWTLQEALAPPVPLVLHRWEWGEGSVGTREEGTEGAIQLIVPGRCATTNLDNLVEASIQGSLRWTTLPAKEGEAAAERDWRTVPTKILGADIPSLYAFLDALRTLNVDNLRSYAIWKCALTRTSSRPVDMVFSIMGLFGITLNPKDFEKDDRIGATIALAREILRTGGTASWIGVSTRVPPCRRLSHFPEFPETSVAGKALIRVGGQIIEAATIVDEDSQVIRAFHPEDDAITGDIDESGYLTLCRKACTIKPASTGYTIERGNAPHLSVRSVDGSVWDFQESVDFNTLDFPRTAAISLKFFSTVSLFELSDVLFKLILVREHAPGKFHVVSFFVLPDWNKVWEKKEVDWKTYTFSIGGPDAA